MVLLLIGAAVLIAILRGVATGRIVAAVGAVWTGILALMAFVPDSAVGRWIGGDLRVWVLTGGIVALVLGYRALILRLRARAVVVPSTAPPAPDPTLGAAEIDRYARHLVLREIGGPGQMRLRGARVLIVGAGGLGAPVCLYLAAAGVGRITLADDDRVSLANLQRQVIFRDNQRGEDKARAAADAMVALNPHVAVTPLLRRITDADRELVAAHDLVLDGTDSFEARAAINRACVAAGVPLIAGAIAQWEGQVSLYDPARGGPCLACLFPQAPAPGLAPDCASAGVVGPLPGVVGSMMALEAIKHLTGAGQGLRGRLLIFDGLFGESRMISTIRRADCPVCGHLSSQGLEPARAGA